MQVAFFARGSPSKIQTGKCRGLTAEDKKAHVVLGKPANTAD